MAKFAVPARPARQVLNMEYFKGVDFYNAPANVSINRSPEAPNMVRDEVGKVRKRTGYATQATAPNGMELNGVHFLRLPGRTVRCVHAGDMLYEAAGEPALWKPLAAMLPNRRSRAVQMEGKLYLMDGGTFQVYNGKTVRPVRDDAYIPTVSIGRAPQGSGIFYEPHNLLSAGFYNHFLGTASTKVYQLTENRLDDAQVTAWVMTAPGVWSNQTEGMDFTVNRVTGALTFAAAPGESPIPGEDNVRVLAYKTFDGYAARVDKCDVMAVYGVGSAPDRLFAAGNPDYPNRDFYSEFRNPTYFPDTAYCLLGQDDGAIMGYTTLNDQLAAHRSGGKDGGSIVVRSGRLDSAGEAVFPIINIVRGDPAIAKHSFATLGGEPLFLTARGVYALTSAELTGERYSQQRSLYLGGELQGDGMEGAAACVWRDFYLIAARDRLYLLDGMQKEYREGTPYSSFQYECYYWTGIDARVLWEEDGALWFGTEDGRLCRFHNDLDAPESYTDDGRAILAYWDTPDLDGHLFYKNKVFRHLAVRIPSAVMTGVEIFAQVRGLWRKLFDAGDRARFLDWGYLDFNRFVFSSDRTPRTLGCKIKLGKVDKARFRLQNGKPCEPFGLYCFALEYTERSNNYKE